MDGYSTFAEFYDALTANIDYRARAEYFDRLIRRFGGKQNGLLLDLACGTGSLSEELARLGYDVIGTDGSEEMLSRALDKKIESGYDIQYLCQEMTELDMFGTIDITICALDSLNHLPDTDAIRKTIEKVSLFCEPGGLFLFDMNTPHKHRTLLNDSAYVYDTKEVYCVWQNSRDPESPDDRVDISLDFFVPSDGAYIRQHDEFSEIAPEKSVIEEMLVSAGFEILAEFDYDSELPAGDDSDKIVWAARKKIGE